MKYNYSTVPINDCLCTFELSAQNDCGIMISFVHFVFIKHK